MYKQQINELVDNAHNGIESGLKAYAILKDLKTFIDEAIKNVEEIALEEANRYNEKTFIDEGFTFTKKNGGAYYDYSNIDEVVQAKKHLKGLEAKYKSAYANHKNGINSVSEDGEVLELPTVKYRKDSISVKAVSNGL